MIFVNKGLLFTVPILMLLTASSKAAVYECKVEQAMEWRQGRLIAERAGSIYHDDNDGLLRFDDDTSVLWISTKARGGSSVFVPIKLETVQRMNHWGELTSTKTEFVNDEFVGVDTFEIRTSKVGMVFLYTSTGGSIETGTCHL